MNKKKTKRKVIKINTTLKKILITIGFKKGKNTFEYGYRDPTYNFTYDNFRYSYKVEVNYYICTIFIYEYIELIDKKEFYNIDNLIIYLKNKFVHIFRKNKIKNLIND